MSAQAAMTEDRELLLALRTLFHEESQQIVLNHDPSVARRYSNLRRVIEIIDKRYPPKESRAARRGANNQ